MQINEYEKKHLEILRSHLAECMVLLKHNDDFPLEGPCKIAAFGAGVRNTIKGGTGSGEVNSRYFVNIEDGLKQAGFELTTGKWLDDYDDIVISAKKAFKRSLKKKAKEEHVSIFVVGMGAVMPAPEYDLALEGEGDVAIYVVSRISGEGSDRQARGGDYSLSDSEIRDILACRERYDKFMLVINAGGPVDLSPVMEVENILVLSQLGVETGSALADVILGNANPSGRLTSTWVASDNMQELDFGKLDDTRYKEGVFVGYRYYDSFGIEPLFPFGYGKTFTSFSMDNAGVEKLEKDTIRVSCRLTNTGKRPGKDTLFVYVYPPEGSLSKPVRALAAFNKTDCLEPGEGQDIDICFRLSELSSFDQERACYLLEEGDYLVRLEDGDSLEASLAYIRLEQDVITCKVRNSMGETDFEDLCGPSFTRALDEHPVIVMTESDFDIEECSYDKAWTIDSDVKAMSNEELAYLSVGNYKDKGGIASVIGEASSKVAGAAGESCSRYEDMKVIVMADGPAGLRLAQRYFTDQEGAHALDITMPESIRELLPRFLQNATKLLAKKPKKGDQIREQFCTAIPIGTAIAQSFNLEFAGLCGDIVGTEMEIFDVDLWLAPALNIHRSPLCGRNFEYFSEDPLVSGKFAAAITRGVQKHPGKGVTIKHFCANNQETNRYFNNSMVSERSLREIYLRGFEICIKEAQPLALMTSYNLLNGIHSSERRDLIEDVLRCEFGFKGVVMTDWVIRGEPMTRKSKYSAPDTYKVASSGHELFMPGSKYDYEELMTALQNGSLSREQLEINISRWKSVFEK